MVPPVVNTTQRQSLDLLSLWIKDALLPVSRFSAQAATEKGVGPSAIPLQKKCSTHLRHHCLSSIVTGQVPLCVPLNIYWLLRLIELIKGWLKNVADAGTTATSSGDESQRVPSPASPSFFSALAEGNASSRFFSW